MNRVSRLFVKNTYISLTHKEDYIILSILYDEKPETLGATMERWPELAVLSEYFLSGSSSEVNVPLGRLVSARKLIEDLKTKFSNQKKLSFHVDRNVQNLEISDTPPEGFVIHYKWWNGSALERVLPQGIQELEDGWYGQGDVRWLYPALSETEASGARRNLISASDLLPFLTQELPRYRAAGMHIDCDLTYIDQQALTLDIERVERHEVSIHAHWSVPLEEIRESPSLDGHILVGNAVYRGITPSSLSKALPNPSGENALQGIDIARFHDQHFSELSPWLSGKISEFASVHAFLEPPYEWILLTSTKQSNGIGRAYAHPTAIVGGEHISIEMLKQMMGFPYTQLQRGWVRRSQLCTLGMDAQGSTADGQALKPYKLSAAQLVHRGDANLQGPWSRMEIDGLDWPQELTRQRAAAAHLEYLLYWGLSGGVCGGYEAAVTYGVDMLRSLLTAAPDCRILVIGSPHDIEEYTRQAHGISRKPIAQYDASLNNRVYLASNHQLSRSAMITQVKWDLLVLIEPDQLFTSTDTAAYTALANIKRSCTIAFPLHTDAHLVPAQRAAQNALLGYRAGDAVAQFTICDPRDPQPLPKPHAYRPEAPKPVRDGFIVTLEGSAPPGVSIPQKPTALDKPESVRIGQVQTGNEFFDDARLFADREEPQAEHIPFSCYWPTYAQMTAAQQAWYFYLRGQIRRGQYPDTDLSYLFVHIYELVGLIGVQQPKEGYDALMRLWSAYRDRHPRLDTYLSDWIFDFIHVHPCGISAWQFLCDAPATNPLALDAGLTLRQENAPLLLSVSALELLSEYRITQSKFYLSGYESLMQKAMPRAVAYIDARMMETDGTSLLQKCGIPTDTEQTKEAFRSALSERSHRYTVAYRRYTDNKLLKDLIAQILRYTENTLRKQTGFDAKLRGLTLVTPYTSWIDGLVQRQTEKVQPAAQGVVIDAEAIERLRQESDEVRDALIASMADSAPRPTQEITADDLIPSRPEGTPDGLLTDLEPVHHLLGALTEQQRRILNILAPTSWEMAAAQLSASLPGVLMDAEIDEINQRALHWLNVPLIELEPPLYVVQEDYRDELEYLLGGDAPEPNAQWSADPDGLDETWQAFFDASDLDALGALIEGNGALNKLASERAGMPDLILDELNAVAMDTVGDLIADLDGLVEDYKEIIETHMRRK